MVGIPVLTKYSDGYRLMAEFEGHEYFLNPGATKVFSDKLEELNNSAIDRHIFTTAPKKYENVTIIDCQTDDTYFRSKFLLMEARGAQFVINKHSTWQHLEEFEKLNLEVGWRFLGEPFDFEGKLDTNIKSFSFFDSIKNLFAK